MDPFKKNKRCLIIDADVLVHKVSRAAEEKVRWPNGIWTWYADEKKGDYLLAIMVDKLKEKLEADEVVMCISSETNFRNDIWPDYKLDRDNPEAYSPMLKGYLRDKLMEFPESFMVDGLEADDCIGILMTSDNYKSDYEKILVTIDKDLDTIPGLHYNMDKKELYNVTLEEADKFFYIQALMGDRVDGIPGCPSYGDKTARRTIGDSLGLDAWDKIVKAYKSKKLESSYALTMARLVRILRSEDWDSKAKKVKLWEPN